MSFNWKKYLSLATKLSECEKEEYIRSAISRAYYSLFKTMAARAGYTHQEQRRHRNFHQVLASKFKNPDEDFTIKLNLDNFEVMIIGNILEELRIKRNLADYDAFEKFTSQNAISAIEKVNEIFEMFED